MFSITLVVGNSSVPWTLLFKTEEGAMKIANDLGAMHEGDISSLSDDFGQTVVAGKVAGWMVEDMDKSKLAHIAFALHRARMQVEMQKASEADPALRMARLGGGPGVITPMGPNGGFRA
jgi:hypothetical protein